MQYNGLFREKESKHNCYERDTPCGKGSSGYINMAAHVGLDSFASDNIGNMQESCFCF